MYKQLGMAVCLATLLAGCGSESEDSVESTPPPVMKLNGSDYSVSNPFVVTGSPFTVSWESTTRTELYISTTPEVTDNSLEVYGYNWGSYERECQIDESYVEIDCNLDGQLIGGRENITSLVKQIPTTLYLITQETTYVTDGTSLDEEVQSVSMPIQLN